MSKRISGVKNFVSNIGDFSREVPFIQPTYPTLAHGVWVSTSGPGSGACSASGILGAAAGGADASTGAEGLGVAAMFMAISCRVAVPATTFRDGTRTSGKPSTVMVNDHEPGRTSANE